VIEKDEIRSAVLRAIEHTRELLLDASALGAGESSILLGEGAALDSMGFINFVVSLEEEMSHIGGRSWDLMQVLNSPVAQAEHVSTVGQLIDFLYSLSKS
jgi:hypothetical protein